MVVSLTTNEKIDLVAARFDPEAICDALELTSEQILETFTEALEENWHKFAEIEADIEYNFGDHDE